MITPLKILKTYWGFNEFRDPQEQIINSILNGNDNVVLLPTGGGKSICYQIPALVLDGVCIVVSPLIALIKDQVDSLLKKNIKAIALTSQLNEEEIIIAFDNLQFGGYKFLYLSPEKLQSNLIQEKIKQLNVSFVAIDEAHCISEWGHDFRPSYLKLPILRELQPNVKFIALTATATEKVLIDITQNLNIEDATVFKKSFNRTNLTYHVLFVENYFEKLIQILKKINEPIIIYTNSRKQTKDVSYTLNQHNFKSTFYHGGLNFQEKTDAYNSWFSDEAPIMVATNAFGMGIDKSNVRAVIHLNIPNSLENYIQEAGRAGRDGANSYSIILTNKNELQQTKTKFLSNTPTLKFIKHIYFNLNQFYSISYGEFTIESFNFSLQEFCSKYNLNLLHTFNALKVLERENIIIFDNNFRKKSTIKFIISNQQLFDYFDRYPSKIEFIKLLLRNYGGIFDHYVSINEYKLAEKLKLSKGKFITVLNELMKDGILNYSNGNSNSKLNFLVNREDDYTINSISRNIEKQNDLKLKKLKSVLSFIQNKTICRNIELLSYFDEINKSSCGKCDVCKSKIQQKESLQNTTEKILESLSIKHQTSNELSEFINCTDKHLLFSLKILLEKNKITITSQNKYKLNI